MRASPVDALEEGRSTTPDGDDALDAADKAPAAPLSRTEMTELEVVIRGNLERYPDALLLTQVGSFYEVCPSAPLNP